MQNKPQIDTRLIEFSEGEQVICELRKHPIGMVGVVLSGFLISILVLVVCVFAGHYVGDNFSAETSLPVSDIGLVIGVVLCLLVVVMTLISAFLYRANRIIATNQKIAQVLYKSLFSRKVSQLDISDVQDVTVSQKGVLARVFNYGTLVIETSGEQENYSFALLPDPVRFSKLIIDAHEKNVQEHGN